MVGVAPVAVRPPKDVAPAEEPKDKGVPPFDASAPKVGVELPGLLDPPVLPKGVEMLPTDPPRDVFGVDPKEGIPIDPEGAAAAEPKLNGVEAGEELAPPESFPFALLCAFVAAVVLDPKVGMIEADADVPQRGEFVLDVPSVVPLPKTFAVLSGAAGAATPNLGLGVDSVTRGEEVFGVAVSMEGALPPKLKLLSVLASVFLPRDIPAAA